ncbi:hypothetical protein DFH11DRAFT_1582893 [Phellopilus nigrolimitatus]|nr:hypothetical protein DFH11DRAFT_1582893 [Phellopilus nigrolimitatus]
MATRNIRAVKMILLPIPTCNNDWAVKLILPTALVALMVIHNLLTDNTTPRLIPMAVVDIHNIWTTQIILAPITAALMVPLASQFRKSSLLLLMQPSRIFPLLNRLLYFDKMPCAILRPLCNRPTPLFKNKSHLSRTWPLF